MEAAFKQGFRTYGGKTRYSSVMIAPAKMTPPAADRIFTSQDKDDRLWKSQIQSTSTRKILPAPQT
jgi:hypothetical protein